MTLKANIRSTESALGSIDKFTLDTSNLNPKMYFFNGEYCNPRLKTKLKKKNKMKKRSDNKSKIPLNFIKQGIYKEHGDKVREKMKTNIKKTIEKEKIIKKSNQNYTKPEEIQNKIENPPNYEWWDLPLLNLNISQNKNAGKEPTDGENNEDNNEINSKINRHSNGNGNGDSNSNNTEEENEKIDGNDSFDFKLIDYTKIDKFWDQKLCKIQQVSKDLYVVRKEKLLIKHLQHNKKNTREQGKEKKKLKLHEDTSITTYVSLFLIKRLCHPLNKTKILKNGLEREFSGICLISPDLTMLVAEGGPKGIKYFDRLLLKRLDWKKDVIHWNSLLLEKKGNKA
ncbi:u4/u6 small nuclear ribonucleoprotein prp3 [Anaeramoeba flamelloides]|uniref:U4/u6 small nuclear ribonucleoprotein prp3 n=1 Tax=Anaeramoeba flamelloides TaxID=1746091 RepID=A0AAV7YFC7_9EUKA|nr:u4/u6 small nuclear ribonucleoprotein prp3 [Anaeramoeba flamelloides]